MGTGRRIVLALCKTVLVFCMGLFIFGLVFTLTIGKPERVIGWLSDSGLYSVTTNNVKDQLRKANGNVTDANNPILTNAIDQSIQAPKIQAFVESGITQTYAWLDGKTEKPQFSFDVEEVKTTFASSVTSGLTERAKTLPACSRKLQPTSSDIFTINCIPPGTNVNQEIEKVRQQILAADTSTSDSGETPLSADALVVDTAQGPKPYYEGLAYMRNYYRLLKLLPIITGVVFVVACAIILAVTKPRYRALRTLSMPLMLYGFLYILGSYLFTRQANDFLSSNLNKPSNVTDFGVPLKKLGSVFIDYSSGLVIKTGIVFFIAGVACFVAYQIIKKHSPQVSTEKSVS